MIEFSVEADGIVYANAKGQLSFMDIIKHYGVLFEHPDFYVGIPAIYDFSKVNQIIGQMSDFEKITQDMANSNIIDKPCYVAIVVDKNCQSVVDIFKAYAYMMDYTQMNVSVFFDLTSAKEWLDKHTTH